MWIGLVIFIPLLLLLLLFQCPQMESSIVLSNCSFDRPLYHQRAAVKNQVSFVNHRSLHLFASYSLRTLDNPIEFGLIYPFASNDYLLPFPLILNCASDVQSCQLKSISNPSSNAEWIRVQLSSINYTDQRSDQAWIERSFYLKQGRYQLSNCSMSNGEYFTDAQTIFSLDIHYEKAQGSSCHPSFDPCGIPSLTTCLSSTCQCLPSNSSPVPYLGNSYCADLINRSDCQIFPSRCLSWCNESSDPLCLCPSNTIKSEENAQYFCRYPLNATNCSIDDSLRRCARGQCCEQGRCLDCPLIATTTIRTTFMKTSSSLLMFSSTSNSFDERLRIALGLIAGLLGVSAVILFSILCWLHRRQKNAHFHREETSNSSTSSLYISPVRHLSVSTIEQDIDPANGKYSRTDSFRQAVFTDDGLIEHVSTQRDSVLSEKEPSSSPNFSTLEFLMPIYQNITHTFPQTHRV